MSWAHNDNADSSYASATYDDGDCCATNIGDAADPGGMDVQPKELGASTDDGQQGGPPQFAVVSEQQRLPTLRQRQQVLLLIE